jgi:hypothetical protein
VLAFPVVAQTLPVIGEQDDQRRIVQPTRTQRGQQLADDLVGVGDLGVVGIFVARSPRLGCVVRGVRIEQMHEQKKWLGGIDAVQPAPCSVDGAVASPLGEGSGARCGRLGEIVIVRLEPLSDSRRATQHRRGNESGTTVAGIAEDLGQGHVSVAELEPFVVPNTVLRRKQAGEQARMRRKRQWTVAVGSLEKHRVAGQGG